MTDETEEERIRLAAAAQIEGSTAFVIVSFNGGEVQFAFKDGTCAEDLAITTFLAALVDFRRAITIAEIAEIAKVL